MVKRDGESNGLTSLTGQVIAALGNSTGVVGPIVLAVVGLPVAVVLDIAGTILSLAILIGFVLPIVVIMVMFVVIPIAICGHSTVEESIETIIE